MVLEENFRYDFFLEKSQTTEHALQHFLTHIFPTLLTWFAGYLLTYPIVCPKKKSGVFFVDLDKPKNGRINALAIGRGKKERVVMQREEET